MKYSFLRYPNFKIKAVTLSYDDCTVYDDRLTEILDKYGLKCTFNINSGFFGKTKGWNSTKEQAVKRLKKSQHEVAIHGVHHWSLGEVSTEMAIKDIIEDRLNLEKIFGRIIKGMAYANGSYLGLSDKLEACGIKYARTTVSTEKFDIPTNWLELPATCHHKNPKLMELADTFINLKETDYFWGNYPKLFYLWGHSYEFEKDNNWNIIEDFAKKIGNREDIWYCTNGEIYDYVKAYEKLEFSADGTIIHNPTNTDLYLCYFKKNILIKKGATVKTTTKY